MRGFPRLRQKTLHAGRRGATLRQDRALGQIQRLLDNTTTLGGGSCQVFAQGPEGYSEASRGGSGARPHRATAFIISESYVSPGGRTDEENERTQGEKPSRHMSRSTRHLVLLGEGVPNDGQHFPPETTCTSRFKCAFPRVSRASDCESIMYPRGNSRSEARAKGLQQGGVRSRPRTRQPRTRAIRCQPSPSPEITSYACQHSTSRLQPEWLAL